MGIYFETRGKTLAFQPELVYSSQGCKTSDFSRSYKGAVCLNYLNLGLISKTNRFLWQCNHEEKQVSIAFILQFVQLQRQVVWVGKECKPFAGKFIHANGFSSNAVFVKLCDAGGQIGDGKCQMPQSPGFGAGHPRRRIGEGEKLNLVVGANGQIQFPRIPFGPVRFLNNG